MLHGNKKKFGGVKPERIAKVMARAGLCSRREAERWILNGRVQVNGVVLDTPAITINKTDKIVVDGSEIQNAEKQRIWRYNKPAGLLTTHNDPEGRPNLFDTLPRNMPRVISIGRLDLNSEGLLLLTNDGDLARELELPNNKWQRRYRVRVYGRPNEKSFNGFSSGITVDGVHYKSIDVSIDRQQGANAWLTVSLIEGKNREIRRIMEHIGFSVSRLIRISFGPFQLGNLAKGDVEEIRGNVLRDQLSGLDKTGFAKKTIKRNNVYMSKETDKKKALKSIKLNRSKKRVLKA
ncbi:MAG: pseudouridine synthase [Rhodospirillales bacterium]|tara:strand:- start:451 stop:1326 length:876 start_codon:yes stop_codon:yes gene_type:complete